MKTRNNLFYVCLLLGRVLNAQDDQNKMAEKSGTGSYMSYVISQSGGEYSYAGINKDPWEIEVNTFNVDLKEIAIKKTVNSRYFYPDNAAYAATFVDGWKETGKEMNGMTYIRFTESKRMVFTGEWIYVLENWKDKDNYVIVDCIKKGELSGFKLTKAAFGAKKEMEKANHKANLQKFLDDEYKRQAEVMATSEGKNKEQAYRDDLDKAKKRHQFVVDSINGKYWNSEEGQRVKARLDKKASQANITLVNDLPYDLLLCYGSGVSTRLKSGEKKEFECETAGKVRKGKTRPNNNTQFDATDVVLLNLDGKNCGAVVNASSVYK